MSRRVLVASILCVVLATAWSAQSFADSGTAGRFDGQFFSGTGDTDYLQLLDISRRMFACDPEFQNMSMLYMSSWNGLVEGPTWGAWWIQNSYGTTYCALPFLQEPFVTFLQNSQALWFDQMGDGKRAGYKDWIAPDGCLCDAASPGWIVYRQGDGRVDIHDWAMEFTAAGVVLQAELLLISRDPKAISHYLPLLERSANFIETRRDPKNNLFLAGPAGNLLAPSYAGWKRPDGTYEKAYLTGLSITYIAALDRLIEIEKLAGANEKSAMYTERCDRARDGLKLLTTDEGYFIKSLDPDGTKHGIYGASEHGYFEASPNHDAIAFRVVDDKQAMKIYDKIASIPLLRRHDVIVANEPGLDDMYEQPTSWLWQDGTWVNGGHWSTCEARMDLAYFRLGKYDDARRAVKQMLKFARQFRLDNPLVDFGNAVYQPKEPVNLCYDSFGPMAAIVRGLFEYLYSADGLTIVPHIPTGITHLEQHFPIRFGTKELYLTTTGQGPVTSVSINGEVWSGFDKESIKLPHSSTPDRASINIGLGGERETSNQVPVPRKIDLRLSDLEPFEVAEFIYRLHANRLPLRIGVDSNGENQFVGAVTNIQVYGFPLSEKQIATLAASATPAEDLPKPIVSWEFGDAQASGPIKSIGPNYVLEQKGDVSLADGPHGKAVHLVGKGWLETPYNPDFNLNAAFTIALWVRPDSILEHGGRLVDKIPAGTGNGFLLDLVPGNALRVITPYGTLTTGAMIQPKVWTHVAATFDAGNGIHLYVNGALVASGKTEPEPASALVIQIEGFLKALTVEGMENTYEARHAKLAVDSVALILRRNALVHDGKILPLQEPTKSAADQSYIDTALKLCQGLDAVMRSYEKSGDSGKQHLYEIWIKAKPCPRV